MKRPQPRQPGHLAAYVILLFIALGLMLSIRYCSSPPAGTPKQHRASGGDTIDVAIAYSPMTLYRFADTLGGFSYDMLRQMAPAEGLTLRFHPVTSMEQSLRGLSDGLYDLVVADIAKTADFDTAYAFTDDVYLDNQVLVQRRDSAGNVEVASQLDLADRKVWVEASSPAAMRLANLAAEIGDTIRVVTDASYGSEQLFIMTALGEIPLAVVNARIARILAADYPQADISTGISFTQFQSWIVRSSDAELLRRVNSAIARFKATPAYASLGQRYR